MKGSKGVPSGTSPRSKPDNSALFRPQDFRCAEDFSHCICPAGKRLYRNGANVVINGYAGVKFHGAERDCLPCTLRDRCLKHSERTAARQVVFFKGPAPGRPPTYSALMKNKIDSEEGRYYYSRRLAIVEPVFANICSSHKLRRFSLRGRRKVNNQWLLYGLVHKIQRYGKSDNQRKLHYTDEQQASIVASTVYPFHIDAEQSTKEQCHPHL